MTTTAERSPRSHERLHMLPTSGGPSLRGAQIRGGLAEVTGVSLAPFAAAQVRKAALRSDAERSADAAGHFRWQKPKKPKEMDVLPWEQASHRPACPAPRTAKVAEGSPNDVGPDWWRVLVA